MDRLLDGDMAKKPRSVTEAAKKKVPVAAPPANVPDYDAATKRVLIDAGVMMPDGSWAQGSNAAAGKDVTPDAIGPLLNPDVVQKFVNVDASKDKQLLAWMLFQAAGGHSGKRGSDAQLEKAKDDHFDEWQKGYYMDGSEKIPIGDPKTPEECEAIWSTMVTEYRKALNPADEDLLNRFPDAFGYKRDWPGRDGVYEKVVTAATKFVENTTKQNGVSLMDKANLAVRQKAFKDRATAVITSMLFSGSGDIGPVNTEAVRKLVAYLASGQKPVPPQPLGPNPTEPARERHALMTRAYEVAAKAVADGELEHGIRERIESELASDPNSRPLDASLSTNEAKASGGRAQPLRTLDDMQNFNHEVFVRFAKSRAETDTRYVVRDTEAPAVEGGKPKHTYHKGKEAVYGENAVYRIVIPATMAASIQSGAPLKPPGEGNQWCITASGQMDQAFSRSRDATYHWATYNKEGPFVYLIAKRPLTGKLASSPAQHIAVHYKGRPSVEGAAYWDANDHQQSYAKMRDMATDAGVGPEFVDAATQAAEAIQQVRDMIQRDVRESAVRLVTALLD